MMPSAWACMGAMTIVIYVNLSLLIVNLTRQANTVHIAVVNE